MPSSIAEGLAEPLLPQGTGDVVDDDDNDVEEHNNELPAAESAEAVPDDGEDDVLVVEEGRTQVAADPTTTTVTRPSGPCYLIQELFHLVGYLLHRPIFSDIINPDHPYRVQVRFVKFLAVTILGIASTHLVVVTLHWEHRTGLTLSDICLFEGNLILLDCIVFFSVGRLYSQQRSVDHVLWMLTAFTSSMYTSLLPKFKFLQHSVTLYEMHCTWPWQLWVFVAGFMVPACTIIVVLHMVHACRQGDLTRKLLELGFMLVFFLAPQAANPNFEFHHWFAGLVLGMHANYDTWFSRATMAWCWGQYMNGIAVWGRDPTLTCAYAQYISHRQGCAKGESTLLSGDYWMDDDGHTKFMIGEDNMCWTDLNAISAPPPDWRHCPDTTYY